MTLLLREFDLYKKQISRRESPGVLAFDLVGLFHEAKKSMLACFCFQETIYRCIVNFLNPMGCTRGLPKVGLRRPISTAAWRCCDCGSR